MSIDCVQTTARSAWFSGRMWRRAQQCLKCHDNFINFSFFFVWPQILLLIVWPTTEFYIYIFSCFACVHFPHSLFVIIAVERWQGKGQLTIRIEWHQEGWPRERNKWGCCQWYWRWQRFQVSVAQIFYSSLSLMLLYLYSDFFCVQQRISHLYLYLKIEVCVKWKCLFGILCRLSDDAEAGGKQTLWILTILCGTECCPHTNSTQFSPSCCSVSARRSQWETNPVCIWNARAEIFPHLSAFVRQIR